MDAVSALSLAANIIQVVDFTSRLVSNSREIYHSKDGTLEAHRTLQQAAENLSELSKSLVKPMAKPKMRFQDQVSKSHEAKHNPADDQLLLLTAEARELANTVSDAVRKAATQTSYQAWRSVRQAVRAMWTQREFTDFEAKLDMIRKQIDTATLVSIREHLQQAKESPPHNNDAPSDALTFSLGARKRQRELFEAIQNRQMLPDNEETVAEFSSRLHAIAEAGSKTRFARMIRARLRYNDMPDRFESIPEAHQRTFTWMFDEKVSRSKDRPWDNFPNWLRDELNSLYWITGKPGSGKSTLMKYLHQDDRTISCLQTWAGPIDLIRAGFFFWNSGTAMQMSFPGLLATLLFESIEQFLRLDTGADFLSILFSDRWDQFEAFGGGRDAFSPSELQRAFNRMISNEDVKFFFVIDGLDEFEGKSKELINPIVSAAQRKNVKICVASRPWLAFEDVFQKMNNLLLEDLTRQDISNYVLDKFEADPHFRRLKRREAQRAQALVNNVATKAEGVFLWVYLVVESLLEGISNADRLSDLQTRLDALPADLEALFNKLLNRMEPGYFRHACELFRLIRYHTADTQSPPTLWELAFADDDDVQSAMCADFVPTESEDQVEILEEMRRRMKSRCMGFLEVRYSDRFSPDELSDLDSRRMLKVNLLHRTARDYLYSHRVWSLIMDATNDASFDPNERWANGFLWCLKTAPMRYFDEEVRAWLTWSFEYALRLEKGDGKVRVTYLDEVVRAVEERGFRVDQSGGFLFDMAQMDIGQKLSSAHLAFALGLQGYLGIKSRSMSKTEVNSLRAHTKRVSVGSAQVPDYLTGRKILLQAIRTNELPKLLSIETKSSIFKVLPGSRRKLRALKSV